MRIPSLPLYIQYILGLLAIACLGVIDHQTGTNLAFFGFYLIPIIYFTYTGGLTLGFTLCIVGAIIWFLANPDQGTMVAYERLAWHAVIRLIVFMFCTYFYWKQREYQRRQSELIHYIVHDLRSPMTGALFAVEALQDEHRGPLNGEQRTLLESTRSSILRLATLTDAILDLESLKSGKAKIQFEDVNLHELFEEATQQLARQAADKQVTFNSSAVLLEYTCRCDRSLILRVAINVLTNALKVSPKDSTIRIATTLKGGSVIALVSDSGPGLNQEDMENLFGKKGAPNTRTGGGFGLRFCRQAVVAHGGKFWAESTPGNGTTVFFSLPR